MIIPRQMTLTVFLSHRKLTHLSDSQVVIRSFSMIIGKKTALEAHGGQTARAFTTTSTS
jgi:hypothetical protein